MERVITGITASIKEPVLMRTPCQHNIKKEIQTSGPRQIIQGRSPIYH